MIEHYTVMGLINSKRRWTHPTLATLSKELLPQNVTKYNLMALVEEMASNASKNPYIIRLLDSLQGDYEELDRKITLQGHLVFPDIATLAVVLETLTRESSNDWRVHEACQNAWKKFNSLKKLIAITLPYGEVFGMVKALSVREFADRYLRILKKQANPINPNFGRNELSLNILEAKLEDERKQHLDNAEVASTLSKFSCGAGSNGRFNTRYVFSNWNYQ